MNNDIVAELNLTKTKILEAISSYHDENFNTVPFEGSWTAGQVAEHIYKSVSGVLVAIKGQVAATARDPYENVAKLRAIFLDFSAKFKSPQFVLPGETPVEKDKICALLDHTLSKITEAAATLDLSQTCTSFELPVLGQITRAEWIWFAIVHTQRHTRQLNNILKVLNENQHVLK